VPTPEFSLTRHASSYAMLPHHRMCCPPEVLHTTQQIHSGREVSSQIHKSRCPCRQPMERAGNLLQETSLACSKSRHLWHVQSPNVPNSAGWSDSDSWAIPMLVQFVEMNGRWRKHGTCTIAGNMITIIDHAVVLPGTSSVTITSALTQARDPAPPSTPSYPPFSFAK